MIKYKIQQSACWSTGIALEYAKHDLAYSSAIWWRIRLFPDSLAMYLSTQKEPRAFLWSISIGSLSSGCFMSSQRLPCAGRWSSSLRGAGSFQRLLFPHENHPKIPLCRLPHVLSASCVGLGTYPGCISSPTPLQHPPVTTVTS